jgi:hypothetical protein
VRGGLLLAQVQVRRHNGAVLADFDGVLKWQAYQDRERPMDSQKSSASHNLTPATQREVCSAAGGSLIVAMSIIASIFDLDAPCVQLPGSEVKTFHAIRDQRIGDRPHKQNRKHIL